MVELGKPKSLGYVTLLAQVTAEGDHKRAGALVVEVPQRGHEEGFARSGRSWIRWSFLSYALGVDPPA